MESNEQTELTRKKDTDSLISVGRLTDLAGEVGLGVEELRKKEKGLMDMDNSMVIVGGEGIRGINGNEKYNENKC